MMEKVFCLSVIFFLNNSEELLIYLNTVYGFICYYNPLKG